MDDLGVPHLWKPTFGSLVAVVSGFCSEKVETIVTPSHGKVGATGLGISSNVISVQTNVVKTMS